MKKKLIKHGMATAAAVTLLLQATLPGLPVQQGQVYAAASSLKSSVVALSPSSSLFIRDAQLMMQDKGLMLAFTATITNNGTTELDILDYWLRIKGKSGKVFKANLTEADKNVKTVAPKSSVNITYYATVDNQTKLSDLSFDIVKWDFSAANYERKLGTIKYGANVGRTPAFQPATILYNDTKIKGAVKQAYVTQDQNSMYLTVSFLLENVGYSSTSLANLGFAVQTDSYSVFDVNADSLVQSTIQPKERKIVTMQAKLPNALAGKAVSLIAYTKDDTNKIKLPSGAFAIPVLKAAPPGEAGKPKTVYLEGQQVTTTASHAILNDNDGNTDIGIDYTLKNIGTASIKTPDLEFSLRTKDNISYPLRYTKEDNGVLLPGIEKTINLTGTIPAEIDKDSVKLVVKTASTDTAQGFAVGVYTIQASNQQGSVGGSFTYSDDYQVKLSSIQRSPLEDNDVLVADLAVTNKSTTSKKTPNLSGYFMINGVKVEGDSTSVGLDQSITIAPNGTYNMVVYTKIPYTTTVDNISFVLTEPAASTNLSSKKLFQFSGQQVSSIAPYSNATPYTVNNIGGRETVKVLNTHVFEGEDSNYFYTEFEAVNLETRPSQLTELAGYLKDNKGEVAPIQVSQVKEKVMPNGKVLLSAWGKINKSFETDHYQMVFGQAVNKSTTPSDGSAATTESIVVKPVSYQIMNQEPQAANKLTDITFSGYTLSFRNLIATLNVQGSYSVDGVRLAMDYDLSKDESYDYVAGDHKIMFEFVDQDPAKATYTQTFPLIKADADNPTALGLGSSTPLEMIFSDTAIQSKVQTYNNYKLNIYDVYEGAKLLIASKDLRWFTRG